MPLNPQQQQIAHLLYGLAAPHVGPQRAREFVAAAFAESGLNPHADNRSTHAHGLYQLLSSGYRQRAQQLGGLDNPRANALAILPDYIRYWQSHPHAAAGQAGAAVERSGQGAGFYARPLAQLGQFGGGVSTASARPIPSGGLGAAPSNPTDKLGELQQLMQGVQSHDPVAVIGLLRQRAAADAQQIVAARQPKAGSVGAGAQAAGKSAGHGINELFYDPLGAVKMGKRIPAIGGHNDHVHVALASLKAQQAAEQMARRMGLHVGEESNGDVHPVHAKNSYHYRTFPGSQLRMAADVSGDPRKMAAFFRWVETNYG